MEKDKKRDADVTRRRLLDAVEPVLLEKGYGQLTSGVVAIQAGVRSSLIGRYFRSFHGLLKTYIHENDFWLQPDYLLDADPNNHKEYLAAVLKQQFHYLLEHKDMQKIVHWQFSEYHSVISKMAWKREHEMIKLLQPIKGQFAGSEIDLEAIAAILLAGLYALVLYSNTGNSTVLGIDIKSEGGKERICKTIDLILKVVWEAAERKRIDNM